MGFFNMPNYNNLEKMQEQLRLPNSLSSYKSPLQLTGSGINRNISFDLDRSMGVEPPSTPGQGKEGGSGGAGGASPYIGGAGLLAQTGVGGRSASGALGGAASGATLGSFGGPVGTGVGAGLGGLAGLMGAGKSGGQKPQVPVQPAQMGRIGNIYG